MPFLKIARLGVPLLRQRAEPVLEKELAAPAMQQFLDDLIATMLEDDGVGLAAPQVYVGKRIFVYQLLNERGTSAQGGEVRVLINPVLSNYSRETETDWEGCLSVPELRGLVERPLAVQVNALDRQGKKLSFKASGFHARVVQHEYDHLDGKVFLDRMADFSSLCFLPEYLRYHQPPRE